MATLAEMDVYQVLWKKYIPVIVMKIKEAVRKNEPVTITVYKPEFQRVGKKKNVVYEFELEMKNGRVFNNTKFSAMAKDMAESLRMNPIMRDLMERMHYKFTLSPEFILTIEVIPFISSITGR